MATHDPIPDNAFATPELWNERFDAVTQAYSYAAFDTLADLFDACRADSRPAFLGDGIVHELTAPLDISNVPIIGSPTIIPIGFTSEPIYAEGSISSYVDLDADATIGENRIKCAALAALVSGGEIIKITSSADFSSNEPGIKQSQMASVRNVIGDYVYLNETLLDTFTTADTAKAAIVTLANVDIRGKLTVIHTPAANSTNTRGVRFKYATVRGHFDLQKCRGTMASFNNTWRDDVRVDGNDAVRTGSGVTAYGISIQNGTMYGFYRGVISSVRHAVSASGSGTDSGSSWENKVTVIANGAYAAAMFDAHSNVGSIYFENCHAIGGVNMRDLDGNTFNDPPGFNSGARRTYIKNCVAIRTGTVAQLRSDGVNGTDREEFIVDGLHIVDGSNAGISKAGNTPGLGRFIVRNVTGNLTSADLPVISVNGNDITEWSFDGINVHGGKLLNIGNNATGLPEEVIINGFDIKGDDETETSAAAIGVDVGTGGAVQRVRLWNGRLHNMRYAFRARADLELLEMVNVDVKNPVQHILIDAGVTVGHIKLRGGSYRASRHANGSQGLVSCAATGRCGIIEVDGLEIDTETWLVGGTAAADYAIIGALKTPTTFGFVRLPGSAFIEILSGSLDAPRILRGAGSPEGVVTAGVGTMFLRRDGGGSDPVAYLKASGTGNTGWLAITTA